MVLRNKEGTKLLAAETETQVLQSLRVYNGHESGGCVVLALDDFPNLTQEVSFKQIHTSDVMIFDMNDSREPAVDFYNDIKDIRNLKGGFQVLEHVQREVDYDRFRTAEEMATVIEREYLDHNFLRKVTTFDPAR